MTLSFALRGLLKQLFGFAQFPFATVLQDSLALDQIAQFSDWLLFRCLVFEAFVQVFVRVVAALIQLVLPQPFVTEAAVAGLRGGLRLDGLLEVSVQIRDDVARQGVLLLEEERVQPAPVAGFRHFGILLEVLLGFLLGARQNIGVVGVVELQRGVCAELLVRVLVVVERQSKLFQVVGHPRFGVGVLAVPDLHQPFDLPRVVVEVVRGQIAFVRHLPHGAAEVEPAERFGQTQTDLAEFDVDVQRLDKRKFDAAQRVDRIEHAAVLQHDRVIAIALGGLDQRDAHLAGRRSVGNRPGFDRFAGDRGGPEFRGTGRSGVGQLDFEKLFGRVVHVVGLPSAVGAAGIDDQKRLGQSDARPGRLHRGVLDGLVGQPRRLVFAADQEGLRDAVA